MRAEPLYLPLLPSPLTPLLSLGVANPGAGLDALARAEKCAADLVEWTTAPPSTPKHGVSGPLSLGLPASLRPQLHPRDALVRPYVGPI